MANVNENELMKVQNQDTEEVDTESEVYTEIRKKHAETRKKQEKHAETRKLIKQEHRFLNIKNFYEEITLFVKLVLNKYISYSQEDEYIRECDVEEFLKSKNTEEFQNQKIRIQNTLKEDLTSSDDDDYFNFALSSLNLYGWKVLGLFN